jgi:hypothetical protein
LEHQLNELSLVESVIVAATVDFLEGGALLTLPKNIAAVDAAFDVIYENKIVFDNGSVRMMTKEEIECELLISEQEMSCDTVTAMDFLL